METIYMKNDYLEKINNDRINEINAITGLCSEFKIYCEEKDGKYGIWLDTSSALILLDPLSLYNSIFEEYAELFLTYYQDSECKSDTKYKLHIYRETYVYTWVFCDLDIVQSGRRTYRQDYYLDKIKEVLFELYKKWSEGHKVHYEYNDVRLEALKTCVNQCWYNQIFPSFFTRRADELTIERFVFNPIDSEEYEIGIGDRTYKTFLSEWCNDAELIRHQFETIFYYGHPAVIELNFDDLPTTITLDKKRVLDKTETNEEGTGFKYKDFIYVKIEANGFANMPTLVGYCDFMETIKTLYEGLLQMTIHQREHNDEAPTLISYNKYKSPLIESLISDKTIEYSRRCIHSRETIVEKILIMDPDVDCFMRDTDGLVYSYDELDELCGRTVIIPGLRKWEEEIEPIVIKSECGEPYNKDWKEYHERGLELARKVREALPRKYDLWYMAPFEDKSGTISKPMLIV